MGARGASELLTALRARDPGLRVMFVSGHSGVILTNHGLTERDYTFLSKPFLISDLTRQVKAALAK